MDPILTAGLLLVVLAVVVAPIVRGTRGSTGTERIVRCRAGHLFTSTVVPGVSVKAIRLGNRRFQWCPVGHHWTLVRTVDEAALTPAERDAARLVHDTRVV
jgi:hypothetical protein